MTGEGHAQRTRDPYLVGSVERALTLLTFVAECGSVGAHDAARELGVAPSTAHRLLATLCHTGYLIQAEDKRYRLGPQARGQRSAAGIPVLIRTMRPFLKELHSQVDETIHLLVLIGDTIRLADGIESERDLHVTLRIGSEFPVHETAGGKAILAELEPYEIRSLYPDGRLPGRSDGLVTDLLAELGTVGPGRAWVNIDQTEPGMSIVSASISSPSRELRSAISIAMPTARFGVSDRDGIIHALLGTASRARRHLDMIAGGTTGPRPH